MVDRSPVTDRGRGSCRLRIVLLERGEIRFRRIEEFQYRLSYMKPVAMLYVVISFDRTPINHESIFAS